MGYCTVFFLLEDARLGRVGMGGIGLGWVVTCMYVCGFILVRPHTREEEGKFFFLVLTSPRSFDVIVGKWRYDDMRYFFVLFCLPPRHQRAVAV